MNRQENLLDYLKDKGSMHYLSINTYLKRKETLFNWHGFVKRFY
ncbi:MAG: hypothetical protein ACOYEB_10030 [Enterococcus lemanii]